MFDISRSFLLHRMIFCKKCLHKQFFLKNGGTLGYKYLFRMKVHYSPLECMSCFFVIMCVCLTNRVLFFAPQDDFCKKCLHKQFFLKMVELCDINILFRIKDHYNPLECMSCFFVIICVCLTNHVLFCFIGWYFVKKCFQKQFFLKMVELWDINIYFVWKTTIVPLSVCRVFFLLSCVFVWQITFVFYSISRYFVKNAYISNFFSKWWNSEI